MLKTADLKKIYRPKKGVPVTAVDGVSITFPEKGLVFLLGKSGCGKSTLLNLLGGLDSYDDGEIIIKGVSSKKFSQQHFDSYRNTYVGFIFQEYNILDEFTVGANIALAIELQGRKASDGEINDILKKVDLEGYGGRKPNELSGGQKQRVAIARALVKNPEIIMADEPTGALDSATGKQVLDTLKKLSRDKLVIVVSHDREFAEKYADRIIELSDGKVIRDVVPDTEAPCEDDSVETGLTFSDDLITVKNGYRLTEDDLNKINDYLADLNTDCKIAKSVKAKKYKDTGETPEKDYAKADFKLIKSKLPMKSAFKMGAGGLKHKKIRLVFTIILSCIAFGLFGLADTFGSYDKISAMTNSVYDADSSYISIRKQTKSESGIEEYWRSGKLFTDEELQKISADTGHDFKGVYDPKMGNVLRIYNYFDSESKTDDKEFYRLYSDSFIGFAELTEKDIKSFGYTLIAGRMPNGNENELAISKYIYSIFEKFGYRDAAEYDKGNIPETVKINSPEDMVGKHFIFYGIDFTVTGVVDTGFDLSRYESLNESSEYEDAADTIINLIKAEEFSSEARYSFASVAMLGEGGIKTVRSQLPQFVSTSSQNKSLYFNEENGNSWISAEYVCTLDDINREDVIWLDAERTKLGEKEIIVTDENLGGLVEEYYDTEEKLRVYEEIGEKTPLEKSAEYSFYSELYLPNESNSESDHVHGESYRVVGILNTEKYGGIYGGVVLSDGFFNSYFAGEAGTYDFAVTDSRHDRSDIRSVVKYAYTDRDGERYGMLGSVIFELENVDEVLTALSRIFVYIGLGFALFAGLMLANFIATSISYKKRDIGVLRAIGSRGNDVFRIFFSESFIIAMINFVLSALGTFAATLIINYVLRKEVGILVTVLGFGIRQILLLLAASLFVAFLASFIPVKRIASKRPIDAIKSSN